MRRSLTHRFDHFQPAFAGASARTRNPIGETVRLGLTAGTARVARAAQPSRLPARATHRLLAGLILTGLALVLLSAVDGRHLGAQHTSTHAARSAAQQGWAAVPLAARGAVSEGLGAHDSRFFAHRSSSGAVSLRNAPQGLHATLHSGSLLLAGAHGLRVGLSSPNLSRAGETPRALNLGPAAVARNRITLSSPGVREWLANGPLGLEQGFTIARPPAGHGPLEISQRLSSNATVRASGGLRSGARARTGAHVGVGGQSVSFTTSAGALTYGGLIVTDAHGVRLPAHLVVAGHRLTIYVNDSHAAYPLHVDPLFSQGAVLTGSDVPAGGNFGWVVATSGSTIVVGAPGVNSYEGRAYVYTRPSSGWANATETAELRPSDGSASDTFGSSVAISGSTVVVAAPQAGEGGVLYVYEEPGGGWTNATQTAELTAGEGASLGYSVAISGSTIVGGATTVTVGEHADQGAAYVFTEPGGGWVNAEPTAELTASDGAENDHLGAAVAISGSTVVAGELVHTVGSNEHQGAVYVFTESPTGWTNATQTAELTAANGAAGDLLGHALAISGSTIVAGAAARDEERGAAYVFTEPSGGWTNTSAYAAELTGVGDPYEEFGRSVASSGSVILVGAPGHEEFEGTAYLYTRPATGWASTNAYTALLGEPTGYSPGDLGDYVALSGSTAVASTPFQNETGLAFAYEAEVSAATVSLALSPASIAADGTSTSTATFTVNDSLGNPVRGQAVTISSSGAQKIGPVSETSTPGVYHATITASDTAGSSTITATDTSAPTGASATATLLQTGGAASTAPVPVRSRALRIVARHADSNGNLTLTLAVGGPGTIDLLGTHESVAAASASALLQPGPSRIDWGRARATVTKAARIKLTLHPNRAGRALFKRHLHRGWALNVTVWATYTPTGGSPRSTRTSLRVLARRRPAR